MTDMLFTSPTTKLSLHTDAQVGPLAEKMLRAPKPLLWSLERFIFRRVPSDPMASPVYADLFDLPPTLLHASESEVLLGDARRYVNKAIAAGSPAQLQTWDGMPHAWRLYLGLESADQTWVETGKFISRLSERIWGERRLTAASMRGKAADENKKAGYFVRVVLDPI
jgi:epsilon-lactone hydrolase